MQTTNSNRATPLTSLIRIFGMASISFAQGEAATRVRRSINSSKVNPAAPARAANSPAICAELAIPLGRILFQFLVADKSSRALMGFEQAAELQFAIGPHHGIGIDGQIDGELPHGWQLVARSQRARGDPAPHLVDQLPVDRDAGMQIEGELETGALGGSVPCVSVYYSISTLCQVFFGSSSLSGSRASGHPLSSLCAGLTRI